MSVVVALLASLINSLLNPIALGGYIACGLLIRSYSLAITAGAVWAGTMYVVFVSHPTEITRNLFASYPLMVALAGAVIVTSMFFAVADGRRKRLQSAKGRATGAEEVIPDLVRQRVAQAWGSGVVALGAVVALSTIPLFPGLRDYSGTFVFLSMVLLAALLISMPYTALAVFYWRKYRPRFFVPALLSLVLLISTWIGILFWVVVVYWLSDTQKTG